MKNATIKNDFKRKIARLVSCIFILNLLLPSEFVQAVSNRENDNLIKNSSYLDDNLDGKPDYWQFYGKGNNYESSISKIEYKNKPNSLVVNVNEKDSNSVIIHQTIPLAKEELNKRFKFTQWIKTKDFKGNGAYVRLQIVNKSNQKLEIFELEPRVTGNSEWKELSYEFDIPNSIGGVEVFGLKVENYISNNSTGLVYFNDPKLICIGDSEMNPEVPEDKKSFVENGYFEKGKSDGTPDKWGKWQSGSNKFNISIDNKFKYEGNSSVKLENGELNKTARGTLNQTIRDIPDEVQGKSLKVNQWIKTENFSGKGLILRLQYKAPNGEKIEPMGMVDLNLKENMEWTNIKYTIDLPKENVGSIVFEYLYDDAKGRVWIDNLEVDPYIKPISIEATPSIVKINKGKSDNINIKMKPENATVKNVIYESSDEKIATVNSTGTVKGVDNGACNIIIRHEEENIKVEVPVIVGQSDKISIKEIGTLKGKENNIIKGKIEAKSLTGLPLKYSCLTSAKFGTVNVNSNGDFEYYPNKNYYGNDTFVLKVEDKNKNIAVIKVNVEIEKLNKAPLFENFNIKLNENEIIKDKQFNAKDPEGESLEFKVIDEAKNGKLVLNKDKYSYTPKKDFNGYDSVKIMVKDSFGNKTIAEGNIFVAPSIEKIDDLVINEHPRLLASKSEFLELQKLVKNDKNAKEWFSKLEKKINKTLNSPVIPYNKPDGLRLDTTASKNIVDLAFMYQITGEKKYADRAWLELENVSVNYPDWSHEHYLDATMTSFGVAIGFDWLYSYLNKDQKEIIEKALVKNALSIGLKYYKNNSHFFVEDKYNWNFVCNTGLTAGALAIMGENNDPMAKEIIQEGFKSIQSGLTQYYPEGDSIEGISYWDYGTRYLVYFLSSVSSAMKGENPFINAPGIKETPEYPMFMTGKDGSYNYSDNDKNLAAGYLSLWFANELDREDLTWYHKYYMDQDEAVVNVYDLLWYKPELYKGESPRELDRAYKERQSVITMRKDWDDKLSSFVGFKGGLNGAPHGDLDIGSFVYDSLGVRWALDLGKENYNLPGYWEKEEGGRRWNYYRKRAEGHNTLIINPGKGYDQEVDVFSPIIDMKLNEKKDGYGIIDMTNAYWKEALDIKRGFKFIDREELLIRDEYMLKNSGEVVWQMHIDKDAEIIEDGKAVILKDNDKRLYIKLLTEGNNKFEIVDAKPYDGSPNPDGQNLNKGIKKLVIRNKGKKGTVDVWMAPFMEGESIPNNLPTILNLNEWKNEVENPSDPNEKPDSKPDEKPNNKPNNKPDSNQNNIPKDEMLIKDRLPKTGKDIGLISIIGVVTIAIGIYLKRK
ncbi:MAG: Ig-like domain-containing protein [Clostridium sp.]|uniref:Ig-like domain-containing protein n=1 Tax=Clostridium sp. TaxID=1506 RepID=UPI002FCB393F